MSFITKLIEGLDVSKLIFSKPESKQEKPSTIKEIMNNPDEYKLEAYVEENEVIVRIKKKES